MVLVRLALVGGIQPNSGEIPLVLLSPTLRCFRRAGLGAQLVRKVTGSATAAALFSAILLLICQVIFR